jgi:hypothetical protein
MILLVGAFILWGLLLRVPSTLNRILFFTGIVLAASFLQASHSQSFDPVTVILLCAITLWMGISGYLVLRFWDRRTSPAFYILFLVAILPVLWGVFHWVDQGIRNLRFQAQTRELEKHTSPIKGMPLAAAYKRCDSVFQPMRHLCYEKNLGAVIAEQTSAEACLSAAQQAMQLTALEKSWFTPSTIDCLYKNRLADSPQAQTLCDSFSPHWNECYWAAALYAKARNRQDCNRLFTDAAYAGFCFGSLVSPSESDAQILNHCIFPGKFFTTDIRQRRGKSFEACVISAAGFLKRESVCKHLFHSWSVGQCARSAKEGFYPQRHAP